MNSFSKKSLISKFLLNTLQCIGMALGAGFTAVVVALLLGINITEHIPSTRLTSILSLFEDAEPLKINIATYKPHAKQVNPLVQYISGNSQIAIPDSYKQYNISNTEEFYKALSSIHKNSGQAAIIFDDGTYHFTKTIRIKKPNVMLLSKSKNPKGVILKGNGMKATRRAESLIEVHSSGFVLDGITLQETPNHLIQIKAEKGASFPIIRNCIIQDAYEQLIKVSYDKNSHPDNYSDSGLIEQCLFQYTKSIGPHYYIGGIDAHGIRNWIIRHNIFKNIASPSKHIAEHAIHLWNNTENNTVESNVIIDSDRGIGFGMWQKSQRNNNANIKFSNYGGLIKNNIIYHSDNNHPFADTGIVIENSPKTAIEGNYIYLEHKYSRALEYRFSQTREVSILNNHTNKSISSRNGGNATLTDNNEDLDKVDFIIKMNEVMSKMTMNRGG